MPYPAAKYFLPMCLCLGLATPLAAAPVAFDKSWTEQKFSLFSSNDYRFGGSNLSVASDGAVSLIWRPLPQTMWSAKAANWNWQVSEGVPATDLAKKGGDDRNLALYFVFLPQAEAAAMGKNPNIRKLLGADSARVLVYVWGGSEGRGKVLSSPYLGARGKTIILRPSGTGSFAEAINLAKDHQKAFGSDASALVGLAISADSDDTASMIRGSISGLQLQ